MEADGKSISRTQGQQCEMLAGRSKGVSPGKSRGWWGLRRKQCRQVLPPPSYPSEPFLASFQPKEGNKSALESYHPEITIVINTLVPSLLCISFGTPHYKMGKL